MAKTREGVFAFGQDEKEIPACFHLLVYRALPVGAFDSNGFQKFLGLIAHGEVYADKPDNPRWVNAPSRGREKAK